MKNNKKPSKAIISWVLKGDKMVTLCILDGFGLKDKQEGNSIKLAGTPNLDELMKNSDIISLHCPLTDETYHIINADALENCKTGAVIINTSRGALIDTAALLKGIKSRKIGGACLDVYEEESDLFFEDNSGHILEDDTLARLMTMPNVLVTSHQAFLTEEALSNIAETTVNNINTFFEQGKCENEICYRCGKSAECKKNRVEKCF